jgi:uncharacterized protein HemX
MSLSRPLQAPVARGEIVGTLSLALEGYETVTATLKAARDVAPRPTATPQITAAPTVNAPVPEPTAPPQPARHKGAGLTIFVIIALLVLASAIGIVAALKQAERRRARRRRAARRGRAQQGRSQARNRSQTRDGRAPDRYRRMR